MRWPAALLVCTGCTQVTEVYQLAPDGGPSEAGVAAEAGPSEASVAPEGGPSEAGVPAGGDAGCYWPYRQCTGGVVLPACALPALLLDGGDAGWACGDQDDAGAACCSFTAP